MSYEYGDDALGFRAKIGVLVPATNTIAQPEYEALRPHGVTNHVARMAPSARAAMHADRMDDYRKSLDRSLDHVLAAIDLVAPCKPDGILLGHSIDTFRGGLRGAETMRETLQAHAGGTPVILPAESFVRALQALGVGRRLAALTPYWPPGDEQVRDFFNDAGYQVTEVIGLKCVGPLAIASTPMSHVVDALRELARGRPDVIVQPGTNLATAQLAAEAGRWLGVPVLSCNSVTYWDALRQLGIPDRRADAGALWLEH